jgi:hypothetical protein
MAMILLVFTILAPLGSLAQSEYLNIAQLREQTPANWTQRYETKWRTVEIDAAVNVPDVDTVPIVKVAYDVHTTGPTAEESGWEEIEYRPDALNLYNGWKQAPKSVDGKRVNQDAEAREVWRSGFTPESKYVPMSDITYGEICDLINKNLSAFGYAPDQFDVETPIRLGAQNWFFFGEKKDALPGHILLDARQKVNGLPIFEHILSRVVDYDMGPLREDELWAHFALYAGYEGYSQELSHLYVRSVKTVETLAEDVPLCAFDKVIAAIEPEIKAGHIRKIYEVELGYVAYNDPDSQFSLSGRDADFQAKYDAALGSANFYLRPMWQVNCLWVNSPGKDLRETASYTMDERNTLDYYRLLVDAQTGELVQPSSAHDRCEFKGFIPWDEVDSNR